jgi:hypothetical protein
MSSTTPPASLPARDYCCAPMKRFATNVCDTHKSRFDCPDCLIHEGHSSTGIIVHDGGESWIHINFCPWCGEKIVAKDTPDAPV